MRSKPQKSSPEIGSPAPTAAKKKPRVNAPPTLSNKVIQRVKELKLERRKQKRKEKDLKEGRRLAWPTRAFIRIVRQIMQEFEPEKGGCFRISGQAIDALQEGVNMLLQEYFEWGNTFTNHRKAKTLTLADVRLANAIIDRHLNETELNKRDGVIEEKNDSK